jgi:outer membrane protein OmpA-like peptidoglycan-associated protein
LLLRILSALILCLPAAWLCAQGPSSLRDDFGDARLGWMQAEAIGPDSALASISEGRYRMRYEGRGGGFLFTLPLSIDLRHDHALEASVRVLENPMGQRWGLVWQSASGQGLYEFAVGPKGASVSRIAGGRAERLLPWKPLPDSLALAGPHRLRVAQEAGRWFFWVDDVPVGSLPAMPALGRQFGFLLGAKVALEADWMAVDAHPLRIELAPVGPCARSRLGAGINTEASDKAPVLSHDGQTLYFARRRYLDGGDYREDIWHADRQSDGTWGGAVRDPEPINNGGRNFVVSVAPDNNTLLLGNAYDASGKAAGVGLSESLRTAGGWSVPLRLSIRNYYNRHEYVNFCLAPSQKVLLMAVERADSRGGQDLYWSERQPDGTWGEPRHMGDVLNTFGSEFSPFLAADGRTLYFASDGHAGYGSADIFVSKRVGEGWSDWTPPLNMGPDVNTPGWDAYFTVGKLGEEAYLVSSHGSLGALDIFRVEMASPDSAARPLPVASVSGGVFDAETGQPLGATVVYEHLETGEEAGLAHAEPASGRYALSLPYGHRYGIRAEASGYWPASDRLDLEAGAGASISRNLYLHPLRKGARIPIRNAFFGRATANLLPESYPELDRLAAWLQAHPTAALRVEGHTDAWGQAGELLRLSRARAQAVRAYLESRGVDPARLSEKGYGASRPVAPNDTEEGRRRNRRVEFLLMRL